MTSHAPARPIRIGTRSSELALRQARQVASLLAQRGIESELVTYTTVGDRVLDRPFANIGSKGLFTAELESDLLAGRTDCAVHSLKDLPTSDPHGLTIVAMLEREDPRDALVVGPHTRARSLADLPQGARVGTSSLRRRAQLLAMRPDIEVRELRGNVGTRLRKLDEGQVDAALLAAAGLIRLGLAARIVSRLDAPAWVAAPGQGVIAIQSRVDDDVSAVLRTLDHGPTRLSAGAERALLGALEGGCQVPIGAAVAMNDDGSAMVLHAIIASVDGAEVLRGSTTIDPARPRESGERLAGELRARGADALLRAIREDAAVKTS